VVVKDNGNAAGGISRVFHEGVNDQLILICAQHDFRAVEVRFREHEFTGGERAAPVTVELHRGALLDLVHPLIPVRDEHRPVFLASATAASRPYPARCKARLLVKLLDEGFREVLRAGDALPFDVVPVLPVPDCPRQRDDRAIRRLPHDLPELRFVLEEIERDGFLLHGRELPSISDDDQLRAAALSVLRSSRKSIFPSMETSSIKRIFGMTLERMPRFVLPNFTSLV
jgi:hypothetical protein